MAFPAVAATNTSINSTDTNTHTVNLPASIAAGNLLIVFFATNELPAITTPSGWTLLKNWQETTAATCQGSIFYKVASGSEGSTLTVTTTGTARKSAHISYRTTGYSSTPEGSTGTMGTTNPDPDSLTPSGGAKDYLWIAVGGTRHSTDTTTYPTNYAGSQLVSATTSVSIAVATRDLNASSEDPGTFDGGARYFAGTIAVSPVASAIAKRLALLGVG